MKEIAITKYESVDGKQFLDIEDCKQWEKCLSIDKEELKKEINIFLSDPFNYDKWGQSHLINGGECTVCSDLHLGSADGGIYELTLGSYHRGDFYELDEDFSIDMSKWGIFCRSIKTKYGCSISEPYLYWPK